MHANGQRLLNQSSTARAYPGCVARINQYDTTTSLLSFVRGVHYQLIPGRIRYALCQTMILKHGVDVQIFKYDHAETVDQFPTQLMSKVFAAIGNTLMDVLNCLAPFCSFGRSFFSPRKKALHLRQFFLSTTKEAWIVQSSAHWRAWQNFPVPRPPRQPIHCRAGVRVLLHKRSRHTNFQQHPSEQ